MKLAREEGVDMKSKPLVQSVPNFSEGRDLQVVEKIVDCFRAKQGIKLLDYSTDPDHNRCVITVVGEMDAMEDAMVNAIGVAVSLIDMNRHEGQHPRIGCADVIPFVPARDCTIDQADQVAQRVAQRVAQAYSLPVYLYDKSASAPHRAEINDIRRGQFEGLAQKMKDPMWQPDFGPAVPHETAGACIIGARMPIIYYNINLDTPNVKIAREIANSIRNKDGGFRYVKAMGISLEERNLSQVTVIITDYSKTALYRVLETVRMEARRFGAQIVGSEVVGIVPVQALINCAEYYMQIEDFSINQILEYHIM